MKIKKGIEIEFEVFEKEEKALDAIKEEERISKDLNQYNEGFKLKREFLSWLYKHSFALARRQW